jgi:tRNA threonylcarbamoyladenosine biosynthesis protein TsaE
MEAVTPTLEALQEEAAHFVARLSPQTSATLVTLTGELGAGKTSFAQGMAKALGVSEHVTSPTFVLEKIYELPEGASFKRLVHIDAYRLEGGDALAPLGFDEIIKDPGNLVVLEWPERVSDALPDATHAVSFKVLPDNTRAITYA